MLNCKRSSIALTTAICAASFGLFGCGGDSNGTGADAQGDVCSISKDASSITMTMEANGVSTTTIYEFDGGELSAQSTVTDMSAMGDNAQAACDAMAMMDGFEASLEGTQCTVRQTVGLPGGSMDQIYEVQKKACDAANEAANPKSSGSKDNPFAKSSNSGASDDEICSVSKTATTVTMKSNINGEQMTGVFVFVGGELSSLVNTIDLSSLGDDATAQAVCSAYALAGATANYEEGKCVVTEDVSDMADVTLDEIYEENMEECEALKAEYGSSSSESSDDPTPKSSSGSGKKEKVVTFEDGIIWQPSYKSRARTFFNTVDEYTFLDKNEVTKDSSGWWFKYLDAADFGTSTAVGTFNSSSLDLSITLKYNNWQTVRSGSDYYYAPDPYPYAGFGFKWSPVDGETVDLSGWEGLCVTYSSSGNFEIALPATGDGGMAYYYLAKTSSSPKTVNISFSSSLTRSPYATTSLQKANALKNVEALHFKYTNDESGVDCYYEYYTASECSYYYGSASNTIKIYKIGKYGTCEGGSGTVL